MGTSVVYPTAGSAREAPPQAYGGPGDGGSNVVRFGVGVVRLSTISVIAKILGFAEKQALAYSFGTGKNAEAFFLAYGLVSAVASGSRDIVLPVLMPSFARARAAQGDRGAWGLARFFGPLVAVVTALVTASIAIFAPAIAERLAPGFDPEATAVTSQLLRGMAPAAFVMGCSAVIIGFCNANGRLARPALGELALKLGSIAGCLWAAWAGLGPMALALGILAGAMGRLAIHCVSLPADRPKLADTLAPTPAQQRAIGLAMLPLVVGCVVGQIDELADNYLASQLPQGAVSARLYARKIADLPVALVGPAIGIVTLTYFSDLAAAADVSRVQRSLATSIQVVTILFFPCAIVLYAYAEPIVLLLLERGAFGPDARVLTSSALRIYAIGIVGFAIEPILMSMMFAVGDTRTPMLLGMLRTGAGITLSAMFLERFGIQSIAMGLVVSKLCKVGILGAIAIRRARASFVATAYGAAPICVAAAVAICVAHLSTFAGASMGASEAAQQVVVGSCATTAAFLGCALVFSRALRESLREVARQALKASRRLHSD